MPDSSEAIAVSIAQVLNSGQVPCIIWGHCLLNIHGVPSIVDSIDYVVPDHLLSIASKGLAGVVNLTQCPDTDLCTASSKERRTPPPEFHMHINASETTAGLYLQSKTLWFLPQLDHKLLPVPPMQLDLSLSDYYVLASDRAALPPWRPGRGSGVFKTHLYPVIGLQAHILLEAYLRLYARDCGTRIGGFSMSKICYMEGYVDLDGFLDARLLPPPLDQFYQVLKEGEQPVRQWTMELKEALGMPLNDLDDG